MSQKISGLALAPGLCVGKLELAADPLRDWVKPTVEQARLPLVVTDEIAVVRQAFAQVKGDIVSARTQAQAQGHKDYAELLDGYEMLLDDETLLTEMSEYVRAQAATAAQAIFGIGEQYVHDMEALDNAYLRERVTDIRLLLTLVLQSAQGSYAGFTGLQGKKNAVLVAQDFAASVLATLASESALVSAARSTTSHVVIMARAQGVPVLGGVDVTALSLLVGKTVIVDGDLGTLLIDPSASELAAAQEKISARAAAVPLPLEPLYTAAGVPIKLYANIGSAQDLPAALRCGADGVGLFRSEFLFMERTRLPTEDEQYAVYREVVSSCAPRPVVIRTLDVGGDKALPYLQIPPEDNPFLGWRSIRYCLDNLPIFTAQLRALLRASAHGNLAIMVPMITSPQEMQATRNLLETIKTDLRAAQLPFDESIALGMMVETPAAAICIADFIDCADFFSIGTNDLTQYILAVDRCNERVASRYDAQHPAVLAMIGHIISTAAAQQKKVCPLWGGWPATPAPLPCCCVWASPILA